MLKHIIASRITSFLEDTRASISLEAVLVFPVLVWAYVGSFVFFDAFRAQNTNMKAAYTVADMLSRETDAIDMEYLDGLNRMYDFLVHTPRNPTWIRVTVVTWDADEDEYVVKWSHATKGHDTWTTATLTTITDTIPMLSDGETGILVEATTTYIPAFNVGFAEMDFKNVNFTSPRFAPQLCWEDSCSVGS